MLRSSLGFHTMTLSFSLSMEDARQLIVDFCTYRENTGLIEIYRKNERNESIKFYYAGYIPLYIIIEFKSKRTNNEEYYGNDDKGIRWYIRASKNTKSSDYIVEATVNPKTLGGVADYITAATYSDMNYAIANFNSISKEISPLLYDFSNYQITRIDYCLNIALDDFRPTCTPEQIINLIKRSDIPPHYKEWMVYDGKAHRMKSRPESFYLISESVNINYYSKYLQLLNASQRYIEKGYASIPQRIIEKSRNIIRFEVQCKYFKTYSLSQQAEKAGDNSSNKYKALLAPIACIDIISSYYGKVIGKGDWYTLSGAIQKIKSKNFNHQREQRLIDALQYVSQCRSLAKAKASYQGKELEAFKRTLKELAALNINPVTIPREWHIGHIPNLLRSYLDGLVKSSWDLSSQNRETDFFATGEYIKYYKKFGSRI